MTRQAFELEAKTPCDGLLPMRIGKLILTEEPFQPITLLMPFQGKEKALNTALKKAHGVTWPQPNQSTVKEGAKNGASALWFGRGQAVLIGVAPDAALAKSAALSDQSDAWACVTLQGAGVETALARLVPLDLRIGVFAVGATARTLIGHMNGSVTRTGGDRFRLMVFRSMARTLVHELGTAMESVSAQT